MINNPVSAEICARPTPADCPMGLPVSLTVTTSPFGKIKIFIPNVRVVTPAALASSAAGQPREHGPEDHDRNQPAESDVAGDTAEHVADDDHREDAEDDEACHGQVTHAVQVASAASAEHRTAGRRDGNRAPPWQVGEQGGEVV